VMLLKPREDQLIPTTRIIDRMIGADISFLPQMESRGRKFYDDGSEKDAIHILRDHGFNYIRLRIFVNPANEHGYSPGKGFCDLEHTLGMAKRVHDAGMKLLLDFHYSDYWADPQQQNKPAAWAGLDFGSLKDTMRAYTERSLRAFIAQGTPVAMVQVGNEINHGLLWPDGHISRLEALSELLKAGTEGVRAADPEIPVMMHLAVGGQNEEAIFWLNNMIARGVDFDIIGISYYPGWHGTLDDLFYNLNDLVTRYNKPVNIVEYSDFRREVNQIVFGLPDDLGKGSCIWEPLSGRGGLFNRRGEATDEILVYDELSREYLENRANP
jgi:arabinogalactan endo-1,4-beta-galactosidase